MARRGAGGARWAAGLWYLILCPTLEGFGGTTEPLATLSVLVGLAVWSGEPLAGGRGFARALALGAGLGLGVYAKQQAGLLALGAAALPLLNLAAPRDRRHQWAYLAAIPASAALVLLAGILSEGDGLAPLRIGLSAVSDYATEGSFSSNLGWIASHAPLLVVATAGAIAAFALLALVPRWRPLLGERWAALAGFALLAGLAALEQLSRRHYLHYALLVAPLLIVAVTLVAAALVRRLPERLAHRAEAAFIVATLIGLAWIHRVPVDQPPPWRTQPDIAADLVALESQLRPGEDLLVIPPRHNEIHFQLGTRSRSFAPGYSWAPGSGLIEAAVRKRGLDAVLVLDKDRDPTDDLVWKALECDRGVAALAPAGFQPILKLRTATLFRRVGHAPRGSER